MEEGTEQEEEVEEVRKGGCGETCGCGAWSQGGQGVEEHKVRRLWMGTIEGQGSNEEGRRRRVVFRINE